MEPISGFIQGLPAGSEGVIEKRAFVRKSLSPTRAGAETRWVERLNPGVPSEAMVRALRRVGRPMVRLFHRPTMTGLEHLPAKGPYMLVANHSAGIGFAEIYCFAALWAERFGRERPIAGFSHPIGFKVQPVKWLHSHLGTIPSTYEAAYAALAAGVPLLVFPGGDHETLRPIWQATRVDFGGRKGFARIAQTAQVPVVPMGITGSHYTAPMLLRARALAWILVLPRLLGIKRWGVSLLGLIGAALIACSGWALWAKIVGIWAWLALPFMLMPWIPWTIRFRIGPALAPPAPDEDLDVARDRIQAAVQALVKRRE